MLVNHPNAAAPNAGITERADRARSRTEARRQREQDARQCCERAPDDPRHATHRVRAGAGHVEQLGVVDDRAHRGADPREAEEQVQTDGGEQRHADDDHLVLPHVDARDLHRLARHRRYVQVGRRPGEVRGEQCRARLDRDEHADRGDDA